MSNERGIITTFTSGVDVVFEWKIGKFFNLSETDGAGYYSPEFLFGGEEWFLTIYPNGSSRNGSSNHVDLGLCKFDSDRSIKLSFSLSLKTAKGEKYNERHFSKDFDDDDDFQIFNRFISISELSGRRSELMSEGDLTVVCTMKSSTSAGSDMELLEAISKIDILKLNCNQALQDKAEAQRKLRVLTNNFKDKEIELQRQLSAKEDDFNSAKRRIMLIEQENASYKSQVAKLEQEMEEKERNLKSQVAAQEKKANENKIAACAAEKNLGNMEQEVTQLRQRLTLLEREQEKWANAEKDEIVRPVPKTCVEACTQTVEERLTYEPERAYVEACTQTLEEESCVDAWTQTVEERLGYEPERVYVEACTQTLEEKFSFNNPPEDCGFVTDINHLLKENRGVDVTFELETPNGKTKLFAHQLILAVMSSYFADEFYDKGINKGHQFIPFKGIDPKAFEQMIRYCYGEKPSLRTIEDACALFKVASEFKVISLQNLCHIFFRHTKIEPENVFSILKISVEMEDQSLQDMCYKILHEKTREVMSAYDLCDVTPAMVYTLLNFQKLSLNSEYELINWIFDWAKVKSEDKNSSCRTTRDYLAKLLRNMNFLALTVKEFVMLTRDDPKFFNSDEIASVSMNIVIPGAREMPIWHNKELKRRVYAGSNE